MTDRLLSRIRRRTRALRVASAFFVIMLLSNATFGQPQTEIWPLTDTLGLEPNGVMIAPANLDGRDAVRVRLENDFDGGDTNTFALLTNSEFQDGTIEVDISSRVDPEAWFFVRWIARGFAGISFRTDGLGRFESLYVRPLNGRIDDETRREHAVQYISHPDWDFGRLRKEAPGQYEAPADIGPDEWIHMRIEVSEDTARLFLNDAKEPVLVVDELKLGPDQRGNIGLWVGPGTIAHFSSLKITPRSR